MKKFRVQVAYPLFYDVEADNQEEAEEKALNSADEILAISSVKPVVVEISEQHEQNGEWVELTPGYYETVMSGA